MSFSIEAKIKCPFYISFSNDNPVSIKCEGVICGSCRNEFDNIKKQREYMYSFCVADYKKCKHYRSVMQQKYD